MKIEFDPEKNARNIRDRGLSFERATDFDFGSAKFAEDLRHDYGERRYIALGKLDGRIHMPVFCEAPEGIRVISFRKANAREVKRYET
jgi:uncharacterized DUF497 family protein